MTAIAQESASPASSKSLFVVPNHLTEQWASEMVAPSGSKISWSP